MERTTWSESLRLYFERAADADEHERAALVEEAGGLDPALGRELTELLSAADRVGDRFRSLDSTAAALLLDATGDDPVLGEGARVGRFEVVRRVGIGGMGVTYLARDPELQRDVALKVLSSTATESHDGPDRLLHEARATSKLDHPSIATVYDIGRLDDGRLFMAMAYYRGRTLAERIREGPVPTWQALEIAERVADALRAADQAGIVHRDVKPANIMLLDDGGVRVLDFGIARDLTASGAAGAPTAGTLRYMSPERIRGEEGDVRSDLWSLGVVLCEMLTGRRPFDGDSDAAIVERIREADPALADAPELGEDVRALLRRCLASEPSERFADASALLDALRRAARAGPGRRVARRRRQLATAAVVATAAGGAVVLTRPGSEVDPAAAVLAVLPIVPATSDPDATALGRELAVTVAMNLDGVGGIQVVDPLSVLGLPELRDPATSQDERIRAALALGATGVVAGTLTSLGDRMRVTANLVRGADGEVVARTSVTGPASDLLGLTDSLSWHVLRDVWREREPPTPSIGGLTTRSFPALRDFLTGERAIAEGRFREAPESFARAVAADSTFWLAYWRLWWSRAWHGVPPGDGVAEAVLAHLDVLPPRDSALVVARTLPTLSERQRVVRETARARPYDWLAWFDHQDLLVHDGGYVGRELAETRSALERVVALDPMLVRGWDHLFWVVREQRDTVRMREALERLGDLSYDSLSLAEGGFDDLEYMEIQARILGNDGLLTRADLSDAVDLMVDTHGLATQTRVVSNLVSEGFSRAQIQLSDSILAMPVSISLEAAASLGRSLALAARGRWTEAQAAAARVENLAPSAESTLHAVRLAAVGALVGGADSGSAERLAARIDRRAATVVPETAAEVAWLLGLAAYTRGDTAALSTLRSELSGLSSDGADYLARTLGALEVRLSGDRTTAAELLAELILEGSERGLYRRLVEHPFHQGALRVLAARWHLEGGDAPAALALLTWYEAVLPDGGLWMVVRANRVLEPLAHVERARAESLLGRPERARWHYARALEHLDAPDARLRDVADEVRAGAERERRAR
jgi:TolB-like protein